MAREFVTMHLEQNLLPGLVDEARLVASELATNAVRHARTPFAITIERRDGEVTISVRDWSSEVPVAGSRRLLATGGRGLMLVDALSVTWGVTVKADGGKSVWARFRTGTLVAHGTRLRARERPGRSSSGALVCQGPGVRLAEQPGEGRVVDVGRQQCRGGRGIPGCRVREPCSSARTASSRIPVREARSRMVSTQQRGVGVVRAGRPSSHCASRM